MNALVPVLSLVFQAIILSWIRKLEKTCNCSKDWRRDFIKMVALLAILINVSVLAFGQKIPLQVVPVLGLIGLVYIFAILTYIPALRRKACVCAIEDDWRDNFIFWWFALSVIFGVLMVVSRRR